MQMLGNRVGLSLMLCCLFTPKSNYWKGKWFFDTMALKGVLIVRSTWWHQLTVHNSWLSA